MQVYPEVICSIESSPVHNCIKGNDVMLCSSLATTFQIPGNAALVIFLRIVARDIGGSDPERMAAKRVEEYVKKTFEGDMVKVCVTAHAFLLIPVFASNGNSCIRFQCFFISICFYSLYDLE